LDIPELSVHDLMVLPNGEQKEQIGKALENATQKLAEGEAAVAASLGYALCRCEFPPPPMLQVGFLRLQSLTGSDRGAAMAQASKPGSRAIGLAVHECPKCKRTDAPGYSFEQDGAGSY
jgi:hypothetical protein